MSKVDTHLHFWDLKTYHRIKYSSLLLYSYPDSQEERLRLVTDFLFERFGVTRMMWGSN